MFLWLAIVVSLAGTPLAEAVHPSFAHGSAAVRPEDGVMLDAIASLLRESPEILLIEVQGHAASNERRQGKLAEARAVAVRVALIARGIAGERLLARGYGVTKPLCPDRTPACLARSRRIDFLIIRRTEEARRASEPRLFGCWTVTASAPAKSFKVGEQLCLTETALVVRDPRGAIIDGWLVAWKPTPARWRADVQGRDGTALPVWFDATVGDDGLLDIRGSGGFTALKARRDVLAEEPRAAVDGAAQMGDSLRECWRCLSDVRELVTDPIQNSLLGETPYSLRSCHMAMSSASAAVAPSRRPRACKRP